MDSSNATSISSFGRGKPGVMMGWFGGAGCLLVICEVRMVRRDAGCSGVRRMMVRSIGILVEMLVGIDRRWLIHL